MLSHAAGPAELPARQICVPDWNSTSRTPHKHLLCAAYQFQCTALQLAHVSESVGVLNTSVCLWTNIFFVLRSISNWPRAAVMPVRVKNSTTGAGSDSGKKPVCVQAPLPLHYSRISSISVLSGQLTSLTPIRRTDICGIIGPVRSAGVETKYSFSLPFVVLMLRDCDVIVYTWRHTDSVYTWRHTDSVYTWRHTDSVCTWRHTDCVYRTTHWQCVYSVPVCCRTN